MTKFKVGDLVHVDCIEEVGTIVGGPYEGFFVSELFGLQGDHYGVYYRVEWSEPPFDSYMENPRYLSSSVAHVSEYSLTWVDQYAGPVSP